MTSGIIHHDLGVIDAPLLLFGGPYSNAQATAALIEVARAEGFAPGQMICTGDLVAYCAAPCATVEMIRDLGCAVVAGNCEIQLGSGADDCGCGFEEGSACDLLSAGWYGFAVNVLDRNDKIWLAGRLDIVSFTHVGARYGVIHGGLSDVARFIWSSSDDAVFAQEWAMVTDEIGPVDHIIAGHCGIPFIKETAQGRWINAGVIGMPAHDGSRDTYFAVLDNGAVSMRRLSYDVESAAQDMVCAKLPSGYRDGLLNGYWPSEDILPLDLRVLASANG